jgi:hypothetical protein
MGGAGIGSSELKPGGEGGKRDGRRIARARSSGIHEKARLFAKTPSTIAAGPQLNPFDSSMLYRPS